MELASHEQHRLPQPGPAASTPKRNNLKACFRQEAAQCAARPKLDMAAIPKGGEVGIEFSSGCQRQVLEVTVVGRGGYQKTTRPKCSECCGCPKAGVVAVLHHLSAHN